MSLQQSKPRCGSITKPLRRSELPAGRIRTYTQAESFLTFASAAIHSLICAPVGDCAYLKISGVFKEIDTDCIRGGLRKLWHTSVSYVMYENSREGNSSYAGRVGASRKQRRRGGRRGAACGRGLALGRASRRATAAMSARAERERFSRHSSRASVDVPYPSSSRDHSFRSVHSGRVGRAASDDLMIPVRPLRSASCRVTAGAPHRLRRHHSSAAECERARRSRRHTLELPASRGPSVRSRSPEPPPPVPVEAGGGAGAGAGSEGDKEARRRRVVAAVAASFFALALASVLVVVVT
ncbi:hypothetical protein EVAR_11716_1 [Eumeta japonica]|uniref:Uncharacterized protein n=1 Tax=Eumeta variegata TaxID=151549 RepID=A0A4C1U4Z4_EUMVA|nr:hypothetical protein EVAR_11716_1 [Eumeta japonica]